MVSNKKAAVGKRPAKSASSKTQIRLSSEMMQLLESYVVSRNALAASLGTTYEGSRDIYTALGYKKNLTFSDYLAKYLRQDIARTIIDAPASESWRVPPVISERESEGVETAFETQWKELLDNIRLWNLFSRVDRLATLGEFAVLLLGFDDVGKLSDPVIKAKRLLYMFPYSQQSATIKEYDGNPKSPRYGLPLNYSLTFKNVKLGQQNPTSEVIVHHSRIIHVAEDLLEDNVIGIPRLERIYNRLDDIERIVGSSSEMFWRGGGPRTIFDRDPAYSYNTDTAAAQTLKDEMEEFVHGFKTYIRTQGVTPHTLPVQISDPAGHLAAQIDLISAATRIPKRILMGSERGELSSSQDEVAFAKDISARQSQFCEPGMLRPFLETLISVGVLTKPKKGYSIEWPDLLAPSEEQKAKVGEIRANALSKYVNSPGADMVMPWEVALKRLIAIPDDEIERIMERQVEETVAEAEEAEEVKEVE